MKNIINIKIYQGGSRRTFSGRYYFCLVTTNHYIVQNHEKTKKSVQDIFLYQSEPMSLISKQAQYAEKGCS